MVSLKQKKFKTVITGHPNLTANGNVPYIVTHNLGTKNVFVKLSGTQPSNGSTFTYPTFYQNGGTNQFGYTVDDVELQSLTVNVRNWGIAQTLTITIEADL